MDLESFRVKSLSYGDANMKFYFHTLSDRIIPYDRVAEIMLSIDSEDAIFNKLKYDCDIDFFILVDDGTIEAYSASVAYTWSVNSSDVIEHWATARHKRGI